MDNPAGTRLRVGGWQLNVPANEISKSGVTERLHPRLMRLLLCLAERPREIVSTDVLLKVVWNEVVVTPDSVYQAIASLRRVLGDDPKKPNYILTVPRVGYQLIAPVGPADAFGLSTLQSSHAEHSESVTPVLHRRVVAAAGVAATVIAAAAGIMAVYYHGRLPTSETVAVLPFLDLTSEAMDQEYFADGITEELIDRLSKVQGLRVPSASASFYYKGKTMPVAEIAKALGVDYVLDGSVRQSGATYRVAARLLRAKDGYVSWTETYDRDAKDQLLVQEDIANEVAKTLKSSIPAPNPN